MLENGLMEVFSRGLLAPLNAAQTTAVQEARAFAKLPNLSTAERSAVSNVNFVGTELAANLIAGIATQWAAHHIVSRAHASVEVTEPFAETVLEQGAAIALGKFFHGKVAAWHAHRAALEKTPLGALPEARLLFDARERFYARAKALAESVSPDPTEGAALQAEHERLLEQEIGLLAKQVQEPPKDEREVPKDERERPPTDKVEPSAPRPNEHETPSRDSLPPGRPKRTLDDFLGREPTSEELEQASAEAKAEATISIAQQAASIKTGRARSERDMLLAIKNGEMPRYVARVAPKPKKDYGTFARDRPFVYATEPADLRGLTPAQAMWKVGWTPEWIKGSIGSEIEVTILDTTVLVPDANAGDGSAATGHHVEVGPIDWASL
jgi:hypothetical protein